MVQITHQTPQRLPRFLSFEGTASQFQNWPQRSQPQSTTNCYQLIDVVDEEQNLVNFVLTPKTYFVDHVKIKNDDSIIAFYDANAPTILIYPPQYVALVVAKKNPLQNVKVDFFNHNLVSEDRTLKLNISEDTEIILPNGQNYIGEIGGQNLIVVYGATTRSIPAQTTPYQIIVMCC